MPGGPRVRSDPVRGMLYDGGRFDGWMGFMRQGVGRVFESAIVEIDL